MLSAPFWNEALTITVDGTVVGGSGERRMREWSPLERWTLRVLIVGTAIYCALIVFAAIFGE